MYLLIWAEKKGFVRPLSLRDGAQHFEAGGARSPILVDSRTQQHLFAAACDSHVWPALAVPVPWILAQQPH